MNVLLTGCAGYIGSRLCHDLLGDGHRVTGVDSLRYGNASALYGLLGHPRFAFRLLDVRHTPLVLGAARDADAVVHLAALVGAPVCEKHPGEAAEVNARATADLARGLSLWQRLVYANTNSGYGSRPDGSYCTEADPLTPISVYGRTKCDGERAVLDHPRGVSLRLATVFGVSPRPRLDLLVNDWTARLCTGHPLAVYEGHFRRNFVGIDDVCRAVRFTLAGNLSGPVNVGNPALNTTKREMAARICRALGLPADRVTEGEGFDKDQRDYLVSNRLILSEGFEFRHALEDGVRAVRTLVHATPNADLGRMRND